MCFTHFRHKKIDVKYAVAYIEDNKFLERAQNYLRFKEVKDKEPSR